MVALWGWKTLQILNVSSLNKVKHGNLSVTLGQIKNGKTSLSKSLSIQNFRCHFADWSKQRGKQLSRTSGKSFKVRRQWKNWKFPAENFPIRFLFPIRGQIQLFRRQKLQWTMWIALSENRIWACSNFVEWSRLACFFQALYSNVHHSYRPEHGKNNWHWYVFVLWVDLDN